MSPEIKENRPSLMRLVPLLLSLPLAACGPETDTGQIPQRVSEVRDPAKADEGYVGDIRTALSKQDFSTLTLVKDMSGSAVYDAEWCLKRLGLLAEVDGIFSEQDAAAIKAFQADVIQRFSPQWPGEEFKEWSEKFKAEHRQGLAGPTTLGMLKVEVDALRVRTTAIATELLNSLADKLDPSAPDKVIFKRGGGELSSEQVKQLQVLLNSTGLVDPAIKVDGDAGKGTLGAFCQFKDTIIDACRETKAGDPSGLRRTHKDSALEQIGTRDILALLEFVQLAPDQYHLLKRPFMCRGDKGEEVMLFQGAVSWLSVDVGGGVITSARADTNGIFGSTFVDNVKLFQQSLNLAVTGAGGWLTQAAADDLLAGSLVMLLESQIKDLSSLGVTGLTERYGELKGKKGGVYREAVRGSHLMDPFVPDIGMAELLKVVGDQRWIEYTHEFPGSNIRALDRDTAPHHRSRVAGDGNEVARIVYCHLLQDSCERLGLDKSGRAFAVSCYLVEGNNPEAACGISSALGGVQFIDETRAVRLNKLGLRDRDDKSLSPLRAANLSAIWLDAICAADYAREICQLVPDNSAIQRYARHHAGLAVKPDDLGEHINVATSLRIGEHYQAALAVLK